MKRLLLLLFSITIASCSSQKKAIQETLQTSYETWVAGVRGGGSGINFYVDLKTPLSKEAQSHFLISCLSSLCLIGLLMSFSIPR